MSRQYQALSGIAANNGKHFLTFVTSVECLGKNKDTVAHMYEVI